MLKEDILPPLHICNDYGTDKIVYICVLYLNRQMLVIKYILVNKCRCVCLFKHVHVTYECVWLCVGMCESVCAETRKDKCLFKEFIQRSQYMYILRVHCIRKLYFLHEYILKVLEIAYVRDQAK